MLLNVEVSGLLSPSLTGILHLCRNETQSTARLFKHGTLHLNFFLECHMKCHKSHVDKEEASVTVCQGLEIFLHREIWQRAKSLEPDKNST